MTLPAEVRFGGTTKPPTPRPAAEVAEQARVLRVGGGDLGLGGARRRRRWRRPKEG
jgi:hypothetical protein